MIEYRSLLILELFTLEAQERIGKELSDKIAHFKNNNGKYSSIQSNKNSRDKASISYKILSNLFENY